jgi:hypothetical protein
MASVLATGFIGTPGGCIDFFVDNVDQTEARYLTVVPQLQPPFDQQAELSEVYYILKGADHGPAGGANTLQLHAVVCNKQGGGFDLHPPFLIYKILVVNG